jgi:hypothetical protein
MTVTLTSAITGAVDKYVLKSFMSKSPYFYATYVYYKTAETFANGILNGYAFVHGGRAPFPERRYQNYKLASFLVLGYSSTYRKVHRDVAQFGSAPVLGTGGRRFESCHPESIRP